MGDPALPDSAGPADRRLAELRRRRNLWVALATLLGLTAVAVTLAYGKYRSLYREHYQFRSQVTPGMSERDVVACVGSPYRTYWTPAAVAPIFAGRGIYRTFDRAVGDPGVVPRHFRKVMHYRPTPVHGEFVFIDDMGRVMMVVTGRTGKEALS